jgi:hypothetical protein
MATFQITIDATLTLAGSFEVKAKDEDAATEKAQAMLDEIQLIMSHYQVGTANESTKATRLAAEIQWEEQSFNVEIGEVSEG